MLKWTCSHLEFVLDRSVDRRKGFLQARKKPGKISFHQPRKYKKTVTKKILVFSEKEEHRRRHPPSTLPSPEIRNIDVVQVGSRLASFAHQPQNATKNKFVLCTIEAEYTIEFSSFPPTRYLVTTPPKDRAKGLLSSLENLLAQKVIFPVPLEGTGFYSHIVTKKKTSRKLKLILGLKPLNRKIEYKKFRMAFIYSIRNILPAGEFMTTVDLKGAYLHVQIKISHQQYLMFAVQEPKAPLHLQYSSLPFGISYAPRIYKKLVKKL